MPKIRGNESMSGNAAVPARTPIEETHAVPQIEQLPTQVTVKITSLRTSGSTLATASVDLNGVFAVRGVKVMQGPEGPFISMPSYKAGDGYRDVCFPVTKEFREQLHTAVLGAYQQELTQVANRGQENHRQEPPAPEMTM